LVGVDDGRGRVRAVLYRREDWRVLASEEDVALARYDPGANALMFSRSTVPGLWRSDAMLGGIEQVSADRPTPRHYRHWALFEGQAYSLVADHAATPPGRSVARPSDGSDISRRGEAVDGNHGWAGRRPGRRGLSASGGWSLRRGTRRARSAPRPAGAAEPPRRPRAAAAPARPRAPPAPAVAARCCAGRQSGTTPTVNFRMPHARLS